MPVQNRGYPCLSRTGAIHACPEQPTTKLGHHSSFAVHFTQKQISIVTKVPWRILSNTRNNEKQSK